MSAANVCQSGRLRITTDEALLEEFKAIFEEPDLPAAEPLARTDGKRGDAANWWNTERTALCLSGGGIRSAAFSLGMLQALASANLLGSFNYLSTVSGGGYIGAWLAALMKRGHGFASAQEALTSPGDGRVEGLRWFTNYLTPSPGPASADTRTAVVLWLRNVLVNCLVFGPALLAISVIPALYATLIRLGQQYEWVGLGAGLLGALALWTATFNASRDIPAHSYRLPKTEVRQPLQTAGAKAASIYLWIVAPALTWAVLATVCYRWTWHPSLSSIASLPWQVPSTWWLSIGALAALLLGYLLAGMVVRDMGFMWNAPWWILASLVAAGLLQLGARLGQQLDPEPLAVFGPLWVIGTHVLQSTMYVGLRWNRRYADLDREWLARLNSDKLAPALVWTAMSSATLLLSTHLNVSAWKVVVPLATGPAAAWLASSTNSLFGRKTPLGSGLSWLKPVLIETVIGAATLAFLALLLAALAHATESLIQSAPDKMFWRLLARDTLLPVVFLAATGAAFLLGKRVNVNRFSLNGVYRNRLVRAFLGTACVPEGKLGYDAAKIRVPEDYTRFDPSDNLRIADLFSRDKECPGRLFPVFNTTLNLTEAKRTAWRERKAAPFTVTPLRSGADCLPLTDGDHDIKKGVFACTRTYGGGEFEGREEDKAEGFTLGGAMTISGAAVSPNTGYHTRPAVAFLMTLFDVRLGAWLPNPARIRDPRRLNKGRPTNALFALAAEMLGRADDMRDNVYLSDGGHFDNLGLYEMLRRECRRIVIVDAGSDSKYLYSDLGDSVRRAAIDLGALVTFSPAVRHDCSALPQAGAYASIKYRSGATGELIYLKPWKPDDLPADIRAYGAAHQDFPHESTTNQFFTESQFESYRHLGQFLGASHSSIPAR